MLQLGPAGTTDLVQGSTTWKQLPGSTVKNDRTVEKFWRIQLIFLYYSVTEVVRCLFLLTVCCFVCFWDWLVLLFVLNASPTLEQDQCLLGSENLLLWEQLFVFLQTSMQGYFLLLEVSLVISSLDIFQWLDLLGFVCFWFVCIHAVLSQIKYN